MPKNSAIKILIIVDGLPAGGVERQIVELLRGLKQVQDITTTLCVLSTGGAREKEANEWADSLLYISGAGNAGLNLLLKFPFLTAEVLFKFRHVSPDIIHTYGCFADLSGAIFSRFFKVPFINGSIRAARPVLNCRDRLSRFTFPYAKRIVGNSYAGLKSFGVENKGMVIHNGVDQERFLNVKSSKIAGSPVLCMVGNFTDKKDHKRLVQCIPVLKKKFGDLTLVLIGRGKRMQEAMDYAVQIGCRQSIDFVDDCDNPESYIASADLCLLLSNIAVHGEGISNAIIEYMALGKVVIASDCGGNNELVVDDITGFLIHENNCAKIIEKTQILLENHTLCKQMGQAGKGRIEKEFSLEKMVSSYATLYRSVLE